MLNENNNKNEIEESEQETRELTPEEMEQVNKSFDCMVDISNVLYNEPALIGHDLFSYRDAYKPAAYLLYRAARRKNKKDITFDSFADLGVDEDILEFAKSVGVDRCWDKLAKLLPKYSSQIFKFALLWKVQEDDDQPEHSIVGIDGLVRLLLDVKDGESFLNLYCEDGELTSYASSDSPNSVIVGLDPNRNAIALAKMMASIAGDTIQYECCDVFTRATELLETSSYKKVYAKYPIGLKRIDNGPIGEYWQKIKARIPSVSRATSSDWIFNMLMLNLLDDEGKAIGVMTNGSAWNTIDTPIRKYFVENGFVETIINLPAKLFPNIAVGTTLIVLSRGNSGIRMIDATNLYESGRRMNFLTEDAIEKIIDSLEEDNDVSCFVPLEELRNNDYILSSTRYLNAPEVTVDAVAFDEVIKRITRGAPLNAEELDELSSPAPTEYQYLMLANIQNGLIDSNLPYLNKLDKKLEKYCLSNHALLLSKNGYPYKVAVAELSKEQKVLANGNLYVIELDEEKADPYYMAAYLCSEQGVASLKRITVGAKIPNIGVEQLKKMSIPLPPMEKQKEIGERYQAVRDEIILLQMKLEKARNRMSNILEEVENA